jgi:isopenicillin N synthase-like dioxygenase
MSTAIEPAASLAQIPVVDFAGFASGDPARRAATCAALRRACETYGFLYLENHGVPSEVVDEVFAQARIFFALPQAAKEAARPQDRRNTLGYGGLGNQALEHGRPPDLKEMFQASQEEPWARPNVWPEGLPGFREAIMAFHTAATSACERLMQAIAVSLDLPEGYFEPFYDRSDSTARLLHYPPLAEPPAPGQIRAGAHTDFGGVNLLFPGAEGGLEIQAPDGTWLPTPARAGAGIVNTGDLIERWTNGLFRSSPHRVVNPEGAAALRDRYSLVLFHSPNRDAPVVCLEPCQSAERPARYPPITAGAHMQARIEASRREGYS